MMMAVMRASALLAFMMFGFASVASAQDVPAVISPLRVEPDRNGVNLANGKINVDLPVLSISAAPRLRFDRVQNAAPYVLGKVNVVTGADYVTASYSVHTGAETSESFKCDQEFGCRSVTLSGSKLTTNFGSFNSYRRAPGGEVFTFDLNHVNSTVNNVRTIQSYASKIEYPDGEVISYTYDTGYLPGDSLNRTFYRPIRVSSNLGYHITIAYQNTGSDPSQGGWGAVAEAALYNSSDPSTPLQRLTYSSTGSITDRGGRVFRTSGVPNALGMNVETADATLRLPTEPLNSLTIRRHLSHAVVTSYVRDGVQWNYSYDNLQLYATASEPSYTRLTATGPDGYRMTYDMKPHGSATGYRNMIERQTDALNRQTQFTYGEAYRLTGITLPEGNSLSIVYDECGNIISKLNRAKPNSGLADLSEAADYPVATNSADPCPNVLSYRPNRYRDTLGRQTDFAYNSSGQLTEQIDPADQNGVRRKTIIEYEASAAGISRKKVVRVCGVGTTCGTTSELRTEFEYWGNTNLPTVERRIDQARALIQETRYSYDSAGRPLSVDGPGAGTADTKHFRYDVHGRKVWEIGELAPNGLRLAKKLTYRDSDDKITAVESGTVTDPNNPVLTLIERTDMTFDSRRNPVREAVSAGGTVHKVTDRSFLNRGLADCTTVRMNLGALPAATATGACSLGTQGNEGPDRIARNLYDAAGQLLQVREGVGTTVEAAEATYSYTPNGKKDYVIDGNGNRARFVYDGHDRLFQWQFPSKTRPAAFNSSTPANALTTAGSVNTGDYEQYGYDAAGNRTSLRKRDGSVLTYAYDNLNRVIRKIVPERSGLSSTHTRDVFYAYDVALGSQTDARFDSLGGLGISNAYDGLGRLLSSTNSMSGTNRTLSYQHDIEGNRTRVTHPDGQWFKYDHDSLDRVTAISENGGTLLAGFTYDSAGRRELIDRAANPRDTAYEYDPISRLKVLQNTSYGTSADLRFDYGYNPASQLRTVARSNNAYAFTNLYAVNRNYTTNGLNQYTAAGSASFGYDANGNLTSDGTNSYTYDVENRLVSSSSGTTLTYDPLGRLWQVEKAGAVTQFLYDGDELVAEYNGSNQLLRRFVHGAGVDDSMVQYEGSGLTDRRFLETDHQGSIVHTTNASGHSLGINTYDEYGIPGANNTGRFQYTGQAWLSELGMYYYKARLYSPTLGRFMQTDPIGYEGGVNLYAYVDDDPTNRNDPDGKKPGDPFDTIEAAAEDAINYINPVSIRENREYGGDIRVKNNKYVASEPAHGTGRDVQIRITPGKSVAWYHTHGDYSKDDGRGGVIRTTRRNDEFGSDNFSDPDKRTARQLGIPAYLGTPSGRIKEIIPREKKKDKKPENVQGRRSTQEVVDPAMEICNRRPGCKSGVGVDFWH